MTIIAPASTGRVTWARVSEGFFVASRAGDYVGCVEGTPDGHFVGFDSRSTPVGRYMTLVDAQRAVFGAHAARPEPGVESRSTRAQALWQAAATVSGIVALGALATAVFTTPLV